MPVTFQVVGNLADFGNDVRAGVKVRATATPGVKVGDVAVHSNEPETVVTDAAGAFTLELVSLPGVWYRIQTPYANAINTVNLAGYVPDSGDPTTGTEFPALTVINLRTVMDEDPTPGYEGLVYSGPPNVLTKGTITTGEPGTDAEFTIEGTSPSQVLSFVIPRGVPGADSTVPGPASTVPGPPNVLTIGTVTASAPGSDADADIGGVSPNQTLDLVIPRGLTGPQGETRYLVQDGAAYPARPFPVEVPVTFVGSANPDLLGVMVVGDSWINTAADAVIPYVKHYDGAGSPDGVVTAQIGSRYIDVNATGGVVEWTKMSGSGNTGWAPNGTHVTHPNVDDLLIRKWDSSLGRMQTVRYDSGTRVLDHKALGTATDPTRVNATGTSWTQYMRRTHDTVIQSGIFYPPAGSAIPAQQTFVNTFVIGTYPSDAWLPNISQGGVSRVFYSDSGMDLGGAIVGSGGLLVLRAWNVALPAGAPIRWSMSGPPNSPGIPASLPGTQQTGVPA